MIYSMTGFGRAQAGLRGLDLSIEISSVNRRNLEISTSMPREWQALEREIQAVLRDSMNRGKLHVQVQAVPAASQGGLHWDEAGLVSSLSRLGEVAAREGIGWPPSADALVKLASLNKVEMTLPPSEEVGEELVQLVREAAGKVLAMRQTEGQALGEDLHGRRNALGQLLTEIKRNSEGTVARYKDLLLQRLGQSGVEIDLTDERILREIALFADKCDISEELTRLESHLQQLDSCLQAGSPVGRKLEFLLQEINREFNTIGSKANNIEVSRFVIEAKNEIERIREQIQNIE
jgi:uncharacterized protein (TIGR00255 family)